MVTTQTELEFENVPIILDPTCPIPNIQETCDKTASVSRFSTGSSSVWNFNQLYNSVLLFLLLCTQFDPFLNSLNKTQQSVSACG